MFAITLLTGFASCSSDDDKDVSVDLKLERNTVEIEEGSSVTVTILQGNGEYKVNSSSKDIATSGIENTNITITGVAVGQVTVVVTDKTNKTASITVTITEASIVGTWYFSKAEADAVTSYPEANNEIKRVETNFNLNYIQLNNDGTFISKTADSDNFAGTYTYKNKILTFWGGPEEKDEAYTVARDLKNNTMIWEIDQTAFWEAEKEYLQRKYPNINITKVTLRLYFSGK